MASIFKNKFEYLLLSRGYRKIDESDLTYYFLGKEKRDEDAKLLIYNKETENWKVYISTDVQGDYVYGRFFEINSEGDIFVLLSFIDERGLLYKKDNTSDWFYGHIKIVFKKNESSYDVCRDVFDSVSNDKFNHACFTTFNEAVFFAKNLYDIDKSLET